jgi:anhydro-N-acetylmuramic acid kinase
VADTGLYIGLMSGTSFDGVDGVLASIDANGSPTLLAHADVALPETLRAELLALNSPTDNELHRACLASLALTALYAQTVDQLLTQTGISANVIQAIGAHGQTVRHRPELGYTLQLNAPAKLVEATGIGVVADFRSRDIAAGGQGAPLVPAFHRAVFGASTNRVILNLGGIANVTLLRPSEPVVGFDTGPANLLMDAWCQSHTGAPFDRDGAWGATGQVDARLLDELIESEPWFLSPPPKSTGRDLFGMAWLGERLGRSTKPLPAQDVQATLQGLTVRTIVEALRTQGLIDCEIYVCGGGARNKTLMRRLAASWQGEVATTDALGIDAQSVESLAFAWLAWAHIQKKTGNLMEVTGASGERILGAYWPA